jgi:hypothetical protein
VKDDKSEGATGVAIQEAPFLRFPRKAEGGDGRKEVIHQEKSILVINTVLTPQKNLEAGMKKLLILVVAVSLVAATSGMAMAAYNNYADTVIYQGPPLPEVAGDPHTRVAPPNPNYAPSMNMNWLVNPGPGLPPLPEANPNPDRLLGAYDQYAVGWGPAGPAWNGTANAIVHMETSFIRDGVVANRTPSVTISKPGVTSQTEYPGNPLYNVTDEDALSGMGYDLVVYGLGYGFNQPFGSWGMNTVRVSEDGVNWITVSGWNGDPSAVNPYYINQDGTLFDAGTGLMPYNNGGFSAWSYTFMTIDLDNPLIVESVNPDGTPNYMDIDPIEGEFNYIWYEGGDLWNDAAATNGNATFLDSFAANAVPIPSAVWLLGSGLVGLFGIRRRKG